MPNESAVDLKHVNLDSRSYCQYVEVAGVLTLDAGVTPPAKLQVFTMSTFLTYIFFPTAPT
jgi:hypothetical protein